MSHCQTCNKSSDGKLFCPQCNRKVIEAVRYFQKPISEITTPLTRPISSILPEKDNVSPDPYQNHYQKPASS
jgi:uncharacterized Zn finger protein (UPF0148 family)